MTLTTDLIAIVSHLVSERAAVVDEAIAEDEAREAAQNAIAERRRDYQAIGATAEYLREAKRLLQFSQKLANDAHECRMSQHANLAIVQAKLELLAELDHPAFASLAEVVNEALGALKASYADAHAAEVYANNQAALVENARLSMGEALDTLPLID